ELSANGRLEYLPPQSRRLEHIRLIDRMQLPPPLLRKASGNASNTLDLLHRVGAEVASAIRIALLLTEVDAAGQLAHEDEIDALEDLRLQGRRPNQGRQQL